MTDHNSPQKKNNSPKVIEKIEEFSISSHSPPIRLQDITLVHVSRRLIGFCNFDYWLETVMKWTLSVTTRITSWGVEMHENALLKTDQ